MKVAFTLILAALLSCILIYIGYRPMDVGMCKVAIWGFGESAIDAFRHSLPQDLSPWIIYSLPAALWVYSAMTVLGLAVRKLEKRVKQVALATILILPVAMEFFQLVHWTDGTYDPVDLLFIFIGGAAAALTLVMIPSRSGLRIDWRWGMLFFLLILFFGDQW